MQFAPANPVHPLRRHVGTHTATYRCLDCVGPPTVGAMHGTLGLHGAARVAAMRGVISHSVHVCI